MDWQNFGNRLQGAGAWLQGRGPEWERTQAMLRLEQQQMEQDRLLRLQEEARSRFPATMARADGMSPAEGVKVLQSFAERYAGTREAGLIQQLLQSQSVQDAIGREVSVLRQTGDLQAPGGRPQIVEGQAVIPDGRGGFTAQPIPGYQRQGPTPYQQQSLEMQAAGQDIEREKMRLRTQEMSAKVQERLAQFNDGYRTGIAAAGEAQSLFRGYTETVANAPAGTVGRLDEWLKGRFGTEDEVTAFRTRYRKLRNQMVLQDLPPGVASDRDIMIAMSGYPPDTAKAEYVADFLSGMEKIAQIQAAQSLYQADYLFANKNEGGIWRRWRTPLMKDGDGVPITLGDVYLQSIMTGEPVRSVLQNIGVTDERVYRVLGL